MEYRAGDWQECIRGKCGHKWRLRADKRPKVCPKCKGKNWEYVGMEEKRRAIESLEGVWGGAEGG